MRTLACALLAFVVTLPVSAQDLTPQCQAVLDRISEKFPTAYQQCEGVVADYALETCTPPQTFHATRPTSHLILAMDTSGSMAGQIGGNSKMEIAKREALVFLNDIPREVEVGLVLYGHLGNNQDDGKAESCAATELVHDFKTNRRALEETIGFLKPVGWTPLGGALDYAGEIIADLSPPRDQDLAPVVYLISDGEETCGGDPVASAAALFEAGVQTTVNTIGFDVDPETAAQLEAIAEAAGGLYYPADTAQSLRAQFDAIKGSEAELVHYQNCVNTNTGRIAMTYHNARLELAGCYQRNNPTRLRGAILNAMRKATRENSEDAVCADPLRDIAQNMDSGGTWLEDRFNPLVDAPLALIEDYKASAALDVLDAN